MSRNPINPSLMLVRFILWLLMLLSLVPVMLMLLLSVKGNLEIITDFWAPPSRLRWDNYVAAFRIIRGSVLNSLFVALLSCVGIVLLGSLSGFVFARHRFRGRETVFMLLIGLVMIPQVLLLVPLFVQVRRMGLTDSYWALILPYIAGGQIMAILICRGFFSGIPREIFEGARIDGAGELAIYTRILLPLSLPVLVTIAILNFHAIYNDFVWPLMVLQRQELKTFAVAVFDLSTVYRFEYGQTFAAYVLGALPFVVLLLLGMKYFIRGLMEGGVKG